MSILLYVGVNTTYYYPGATWPGNNLELLGYNWNDVMYLSSTDSQSYGWSIGLVRRPHVGGLWSDNDFCGSRTCACSHLSIDAKPFIATRGCNQGGPFLHYYPGATWTSNVYALTVPNVGHPINSGSVWHPAVDSHPVTAHQGLLRREIVGRSWVNSDGVPYVTPRFGNSFYFSTYVAENISTRGCNKAAHLSHLFGPLQSNMVN